MTHNGPVRLAVCEAPAGMTPDDVAWDSLTSDAQAANAEVFLLNEMPFGPWICASDNPDFDELLAVQRLHERGAERFTDLGADFVLGSRPTFEEGASVQEGFVWSAKAGTVPIHTKQFFPTEQGWFETLWFERGERHFTLADVAGLKVGFLISTDIMFNEWARHYGRLGADLIAAPRATQVSTLHRWKTAVQMAAVVSGCYVASSNRAGEESGVDFGGLGWIVDPSGVVIAETSADEPVVAADIYRSVSAHAKREYPCYVEELPAPAPDLLEEEL